jgi:hypothetical protein
MPLFTLESHAVERILDARGPSFPLSKYPSCFFLAMVIARKGISSADLFYNAGFCWNESDLQVLASYANSSRDQSSQIHVNSPSVCTNLSHQLDESTLHHKCIRIDINVNGRTLFVRMVRRTVKSLTYSISRPTS